MQMSRKLVVVLLVIVTVATGGFYLYRASLRPNLELTQVQIGSTQTNPRIAVAENWTISSSSSFTYTATSDGTAILVLDNSFGNVYPKNGTISYSAPGISNTRGFGLPSYTADGSIQVALKHGQTISGNFSITGGNEINFEIRFYTCTETISFSLVLVNSGGANGYGTLSLLAQNGTEVYSNRYYVLQGQQLPVSDTASVGNCKATTLHAVLNTP